MITGPLYNQLKFLALVLLPALGTLYFTLSGIWDLPAGEEVVGTIVAVDAFLGVILQISSTNYNSNLAQGVIDVTSTPTGTSYILELDGDPEKILQGKDRVLFDVKKTASEDPRPKPSDI